MHLLQIHEPGQTPAPHAAERNTAVGIDLGTTHSVVAYAHEGKVEVLRDAHGNALLPSAVHYGEGGAVTVGQQAKEWRAQGNPDAVTSIKRLMGRAAHEIAHIAGMLPYRFAKHEGMARLLLAGQERTPVEISAAILRALKQQAETALDREVTQAVITVPAYFDDAARTATKDAARLAGLEVLRLINEPTAAALAYGIDTQAEGIYAIYDLGGGTFDISLLKLEKGVFQVLSTGGDTALGGDDFDHAIAEYILKTHQIKATEHTLGELLAAARSAKESLSDAEETALTYQETAYKLTRAQLHALLEPWVEKTLHACAGALSDAHLSTSDIKGVVLVGGSTRIPLVREKVAAYFGSAPYTGVNPDEVVAVGAALQAEGLTQGSDNLLLDVVPLSLGLETMGELTEKLIHRNTPIPVSVTQEFTTYQDGQTGMQIHILQGEREMVPQNRSLARFELKGIPPMPAGIARIAVTFTVDADGLLTVSAEEKTTGTRQEIVVRPSYGLPPEDIERMLLESMQHARADITERLLAEARVEAGRLIAELESALHADGELMPEQERKLVNAQIGYVREAIAGDDRERIDVEVQQLGAMTQAFAERRMNKAIASVLKGTHVNSVSETEN